MAYPSGLQRLASLPQAQVANVPHAVLVRRVGPLPWTHQAADAAMSYFSRDRRVRAPLSVLWYGDGPGQGFWCWHDCNTGVKPQVVGGRLFALHNHELWACGTRPTVYGVRSASRPFNPSSYLPTASSGSRIVAPRFRLCSICATHCRQ
jgi:hypothetical protein